MKTIEQIAFRVIEDRGGSRMDSQEELLSFARRFLAEWKKQQVPVAYKKFDDDVFRGWETDLYNIPLYTLTEEENA